MRTEESNQPPAPLSAAGRDGAPYEWSNWNRRSPSEARAHTAAAAQTPAAAAAAAAGRIGQTQALAYAGVNYAPESLRRGDQKRRLGEDSLQLDSTRKRKTPLAFYSTHWLTIRILHHSLYV